MYNEESLEERQKNELEALKVLLKQLDIQLNIYWNIF